MVGLPLKLSGGRGAAARGAEAEVAALRALAPDLVVMNTEENRAEDAAALEARGVAVLALAIDTLDDVVSELARLASAIAVDVAPIELPPPVESTGRVAFLPV